MHQNSSKIVAKLQQNCSKIAAKLQQNCCKLVTNLNSSKIATKRLQESYKKVLSLVVRGFTCLPGLFLNLLLGVSAIRFDSSSSHEIPNIPCSRSRVLATIFVVISKNRCKLGDSPYFLCSFVFLLTKIPVPCISKNRLLVSQDRF